MKLKTINRIKIKFKLNSVLRVIWYEKYYSIDLETIKCTHIK